MTELLDGEIEGLLDGKRVSCRILIPCTMYITNGVRRVHRIQLISTIMSLYSLTISCFLILQKLLCGLLKRRLVLQYFLCCDSYFSNFHSGSINRLFILFQTGVHLLFMLICVPQNILQILYRLLTVF
jgi:membrane glycosyltransferase